MQINKPNRIFCNLPPCFLAPNSTGKFAKNLPIKANGVKILHMLFAKNAKPPLKKFSLFCKSSSMAHIKSAATITFSACNILFALSTYENESKSKGTSHKNAFLFVVCSLFLNSQKSNALFIIAQSVIPIPT